MGAAIRGNYKGAVIRWQIYGQAIWGRGSYTGADSRGQLNGRKLYGGDKNASNTGEPMSIGAAIPGYLYRVNYTGAAIQGSYTRADIQVAIYGQIQGQLYGGCHTGAAI